MTTCREFFTFSWPLRGRGGRGRPKRSAWPLFSRFFFITSLTLLLNAGKRLWTSWIDGKLSAGIFIGLIGPVIWSVHIEPSHHSIKAHPNPTHLVTTRTRNKMKVAIESGKGMKVKVVKLCWNKWNGPFLMYIYDKQCGIMQKNQWKGPNFQIQCFYNGTSGALCWKRQKKHKSRETKTQITQIFEKVWPI